MTDRYIDKFRPSCIRPEFRQNKTKKVCFPSIKNVNEDGAKHTYYQPGRVLTTSFSFGHALGSYHLFVQSPM